jgi:hypothetical protein
MSTIKVSEALGYRIVRLLREESAVIKTAAAEVSDPPQRELLERLAAEVNADADRIENEL